MNTSGITITDLSRKLKSWFSKNRRDLPWRRMKSPYGIWLSEIMLQQTQVSTVIPYYVEFLKKYPTIDDLAKAKDQDVLKAWEGLGYYSRVRNMHKAARIVMEHHEGELPESFDEILKLPGIGRYTAGAICSIAFGQRKPVLDGNVIRVLSRLFAVEKDPGSPVGKNIFWKLAEEVLPAWDPGLFNEALMELGALVCTPRRPLCHECPLSSQCIAFRTDRQLDLPVRKKRQPTPHYNIGAGLIWKEGKLLITRRKENGLLGGLWEFPGGKQEDGETIPQCVEREINEELGIQVESIEHFMTVKHAYTHFRITLQIYHCRWLEGTPSCHSCTDFRWVNPSQLDQFPFPRANRRIIERMQELPKNILSKNTFFDGDRIL